MRVEETCIFADAVFIALFVGLTCQRSDITVRRNSSDGVIVAIGNEYIALFICYHTMQPTEADSTSNTVSTATDGAVAGIV